MVKTKKPTDVNLPGSRWTVKKLIQLVEAKTGRRVCRNTIRSILRRSGLSWKKCKKLLGRANPDKRADFVGQLAEMFEATCQENAIMVYIDEVHLHQDMDIGYSWSVKGQADWVVSQSPGLSAKLNWYGAYDFTNGRCLIWEHGRCNSDNTVKFFEAMTNWLNVQDKTVYIIMDGAPWHRAGIVYEAAKRLGLKLVRLPAYSPDLNPIEGLWKWMREEITQRHCHSSLAELQQACFEFIERINLNANLLIKRLWPKFDLNPDYEKLLVSK